tara:strand:- start:760 stop:1605 length:846 start_codon:yes stop_codon:yes gene_type:complete
MSKYNLTFVVIILAVLQSCAMFEKKAIDPYKTMSEAELYNEGSIFLSNGDIPQAVAMFELLEIRYPFSTSSQQSVLDLAYAYYDFGNKDEAIAECDRFIDLYPNHPNLDYAYYLRALSNLEKEQPFFQEILGQDIAKYDVTRLLNSYNDFLLIANKFKGSKYADDSRNRLVFLRNNMANHEVYVASYYLKIGAYIASSERAKYMLENYPGAPAAKNALIILIDSYNNLKMYELAKETADVLKTNYPNYTYILDKDKSVLINDKDSITDDTNDDSFLGLGLF